MCSVHPEKYTSVEPYSLLVTPWVCPYYGLGKQGSSYDRVKLIKDIKLIKDKDMENTIFSSS